MTPAAKRKQVQLCRAIATLLAELANSLETEIPEAEPARGPGRPRLNIAPELVAEVLRLRHVNGRLGALAIGNTLGLSRYAVEQILADHLAAEKGAKTAEKPSAKRDGKARSKS